MGQLKTMQNHLRCAVRVMERMVRCVLPRSIRPEMITEVALPGCKGIWTVYHKNACGHNVESSDDEYHAFLIISLEARTMKYDADPAAKAAAATVLGIQVGCGFRFKIQCRR
ncbi:hypothetical protein RchiOBHm_Chr6g0293481 [Rosa chinensis]|uniref:RSE1/DDB1/CPSF1 second beta-propeller domain-containing protein n=1 Tax=Rosa chinensis TaxID=74649 RepID=A0A2P6PWL9_ROSCH|nr:hypothetical protein RchiOBHm_Chr6g0293481 [Rosa chinensis]